MLVRANQLECFKRGEGYLGYKVASLRLQSMRDSKEDAIRLLMPSDQAFLWEMLYLSLFVPEGGAPFDRNIVEQPALARYVENWGRVGDFGFVALDENCRPVGAVWLRLFKDEERGFGYVDDETPELGMAVLPEFRNQGIGTKLLSRLIEAAENSYESISLSVAIENPALRLYRRLGFEVVGENGGSLTMKRKLNQS